MSTTRSLLVHAHTPVRAPQSTIGSRKPGLVNVKVSRNSVSKCGQKAPMFSSRIALAPGTHTRKVLRGCATRQKVLAPGSAVCASTTTKTADAYTFSDTRNWDGGELSISLVESPEDGSTTLTLRAGEGLAGQGLQLHWGVGSDWHLPPDEILPADSVPFGDGKAVRTPFQADGTLTLSVPSDCDVDILSAVMVRGDDWLHPSDGGGDLIVPLAPPVYDPNELLTRIAEHEGNEGMNLFRRYCLANEWLQEAVESGPAGAAAMLAWLRLSSTRQLPWYDGGNYQGKDMSHVQESLSQRMATAAATAGDPCVRHLLRLALKGLPRGGGNGDDIRMGILHIMRDNGIKEGHRPGIEDQFIAQWHQKLHSNTTVDDISICEAYLHFLHTGNWDDFWAHLWDNAGLTREDLLGMKAGWRSNGITGPALHMPHLIPAFQHFLWILKVTHSGADLDTGVQMASGHVDEQLRWDLNDLLQHRDEWWVPGKIVQIRENMQHTWRNENVSRDVLLLDIGLEQFFRTKAEAMGGLQGDDAAAVLELALANACIGTESERLWAALESWRMVLHHAPHDRWSREWGLLADAALQTVALAVEYESDRLVSLLGPCADRIGEAGGVRAEYLANFAEEVVRGHPLFVVDQLVGAVQGRVREAAGRAPWEVASSGGEGGAMGSVVVRELAAMQGEDLTADGPLVVLSEAVGGLEDVPPGVAAVLTAAPLDMLSHIAIRARAQGVLLASTSDKAAWAAVLESEGTFSEVRIDATSGAVSLSPADPAAASGAPSAAAGAQVSVQKITPPAGLGYVVRPAQYGEGVVGGKSRGLAELQAVAGSLGDGVHVPASVALPFGTFERVLQADAAVAAALQTALATLGQAQQPEDVRAALAAVRQEVEGLQLSPELELELLTAAKEEGLDLADALGEGEAQVWGAIKQVWASKWTERAYLSRRACSIPEENLAMGVLLMKVVPAQYAFVLHTAHPLTGNPDEVVGQVVVGLGEALVGNSAGRALSFTYSKASKELSVSSLPSKAEAHVAPAGSLIARSDSNGEDLENFAGAGLYDSVVTPDAHTEIVKYAQEPLLLDSGFREGLLRQLAEVATGVETAFGSPQDIEGAVVDGQIYLLQARAQVL